MMQRTAPWDGLSHCLPKRNSYRNAVLIFYQVRAQRNWLARCSGLRRPSILSLRFVRKAKVKAGESSVIRKAKTCPRNVGFVLRFHRCHRSVDFGLTYARAAWRGTAHLLHHTFEVTAQARHTHDDALAAISEDRIGLADSVPEYLMHRLSAIIQIADRLHLLHD